MDAQHEALLRTMSERIDVMFENMRWAEAGVVVHRFVAGLAETTSDA